MSFFEKLKNTLKSKPKDHLQPKANLTCFRCGSKRVIQNGAIGDSTYDISAVSPLSYQVELKEKGALNRPKAAYEWVYANLCADCGYIDWHMPPEKAQELWKVYQNRNLSQ